MTNRAKIGLAGLGCAAAVAVAAYLAPPVWRAVNASDAAPAWLHHAVGSGPERLFGRLSLFLVALVLAAASIACGIRRPADLGWQGGKTFLRELVVGLAVGLGMLALLGGLSVLSGARVPAGEGWGALGDRWHRLARAGLGAAVFEETLFRGLILLAFARAGRPVLGAVAGSALYAAAHWIRPEPGAAAAGDVGALALVRSAWSGLAALPAEAVYWFVLFAAALALCVSVLRTRRLGWAIGLHAGWVMGRKALIFLTDTVPVSGWPRVLFGADGALQGVAAALAMGVLALFLWNLPAEEDAPPCCDTSSD